MRLIKYLFICMPLFVSAQILDTTIHLYKYISTDCIFYEHPYIDEGNVWGFATDYPHKNNLSWEYIEFLDKYNNLAFRIQNGTFVGFPTEAKDYTRYSPSLKKGYTKCIGITLWGTFLEYPFLFDCHHEGVYPLEYDLYAFLLFAKCQGYYYLDAQKNYKVYQFIYYYKTKLKIKYKVAEIDFCPKLGMIRHKSFQDLRGEHTIVNRLKSIFRGKMISEFKLSTINNVPLSQIIQKDTCFTPFCDIDKVGCE